MKIIRAASLAVLMLPLTGCVFAIGNDALGEDDVLERLDEIEARLDRMESRHHRARVMVRGDDGLVVVTRSGDSERLDVEEIEMEILEEEEIDEKPVRAR